MDASKTSAALRSIPSVKPSRLCLLAHQVGQDQCSDSLPPPSPVPISQQVRDEYGNGRPVMLYALRPGSAAAAAAAGVAPPAADDLAEPRRRVLNEGLSLSLLAPLCSTFVPLAPPAQAAGALPLLRWQQGSAYQASALCAAALDTATLPYRLLASGLSPAAATGEPAGQGLD